MPIQLDRSGESLSVGIFCGAHHGIRAAYERSARDMATAIVGTASRLIYGGSGVGLMGVIADECIAAGVEVVGVIPDFLVQAEVAHRSVTDLRIVASMSERKELIIQLADVFVALPGGLGTLDELLEVLTLNQLGVIAKPVGLLDSEGYFSALLDQLRHGRNEGFIAADIIELLSISPDAGELLESLRRRSTSRPPVS